MKILYNCFMIDLQFLGDDTTVNIPVNFDYFCDFFDIFYDISKYDEIKIARN